MVQKGGQVTKPCNHMVGCKKKFPEFREMFMNICEHFVNVHVHITSRTCVHEQFTKYHELFTKVRDLGGNFFLQPTVVAKMLCELLYII